MNFRNISSWCIRNPVPPIVLFAGLLLAGIVAFMQMDVNNFPDIEFPAVEVTVSQPGAAPSEMENQITQRIEAAIRSVENVEEINSSLREGFSSTQVSFQIGTPLDRATDDVQTAIDQIRSDLPEGILEPQVQRMQTNEGGEISFIAAETNDLTLEQLSWYIDDTVARRLLSIEGLAAVTREGGVDRQIRVTLDPVSLRSQGIHRRPGQSAAAPAQHQRLWGPRRACRLRTDRPRPRQCRRPASARRNPDRGRRRPRHSAVRPRHGHGRGLGRTIRSDPQRQAGRQLQH